MKYNTLNGNGINANTLKSFLSGSYKPSKQQQHNIDGYIRDNTLSGKRATVYHNPNTNETIVTHKGTQSIQDWGTNLLSSVGMAGNTTRMKHAKKIQKQAEDKYGRDNVITTGHSLGAKLAETVGQNSKEVITYNKPTTLENIGKKIANKQTDIRTHNDPVSLLHGYQRNTKNIHTIDSGTYNPLIAHNTDQLSKLENSVVGKGINKTNKWINHVKEHARKHHISFGNALKQAKSTYKR